MKRLICFLLVFVIALSGCSRKNNANTAWQEQYDLGVRYLSDGNYEEAIIAFTAAIEIDPKRVEAYVGLADVYYATGDTVQAEEVLSRIPTEVTDTHQHHRQDHDDGSYTIFEYYASGNVARMIYYGADGTIWTSSEYDILGKEVRNTQYNADGTVLCYTTYEYNAEGHCVRKIESYPPNGWQQISEYIYAKSSFEVVVRFTLADYQSGETIDTCEVIHTMQNKENSVETSGFGIGGGELYHLSILERTVSGNSLRRISYNADGTVDSVEEY